MDEETRAEVAEEATPETATEQTEQRSDDYDGLARRLDDVLAKLAALEDKLDRIEGAAMVLIYIGYVAWLILKVL